MVFICIWSVGMFLFWRKCPVDKINILLYILRVLIRCQQFGKLFSKCILKCQKCFLLHYVWMEVSAHCMTTLSVPDIEKFSIWVISQKMHQFQVKIIFLITVALFKSFNNCWTFLFLVWKKFFFIPSASDASSTSSWELFTHHVCASLTFHLVLLLKICFLVQSLLLLKRANLVLLACGLQIETLIRMLVICTTGIPLNLFPRSYTRFIFWFLFLPANLSYRFFILTHTWLGIE